MKTNGKDFKESKKGNTRKPNPRKRSYGSKSGNRGSKPAFNRTDAPTGSFSKQLPSNGASIFFPDDSMSMMAMGNPVSSPGQSNFFDAWNVIFDQVNDPDAPNPYSVTASSTFSQRAANAMRILIAPYFGATSTFTQWATGAGSGTSDPLQIAAVNLKQFIDTSFGTVTSYDSQDLMLYLMAISAVYPWIAEIKRDLRLAITYETSVYPQFLPQGIFSLLCIPDDHGNYDRGQGAAYTAKNLRSLVDELNQIIVAFNNLPVPPEIALFRYNDDFFDAIFTDTPDFKTAQLYVFQNAGYWRYEENANPYPMLRWCDTSDETATPPLTVGGKIEVLRDMVHRLTALQTSSTAMLQNLYNAYGSRDLVKVETFDPAAITPEPMVCDEDMLITIENMSIMPYGSVTIGNIAADAINNRCEGHVYLRTGLTEIGATRPLVNLPLQFHKDYDQITKNDIGRALRLKPMLRNYKHIVDFDGTSQSSITTVSADGYTGFAIPRRADAMWLSGDGGFSRKVFSPSTNNWSLVAQDFKAAPIPFATTGTAQAIGIGSYGAHRDVEWTYRLEDVRMFWTYLTVIVYGADLNRNFTGTRLKG